MLLARWKPAARRPLARALAAGAAAGVMVVLQAWLAALVLHRALVERASLSDVAPLLAGLAATIAARALFAFLADRFGFAAARAVIPELRKGLLEKLDRVGPVGLVAQPSGALTAAVSEGVRGIEPFFSRYLPASFQAAFIPLGIFVVVAPLDWISGLALLVTAPLIPFFMVLIGKGAEALNQRQWLKLQRMSGHFLDAVQGLATIKAFNAGLRMTRAVAESAESYRRETMVVLRIAFLSALTLEFFATVSIAILAVLIGFRLLWGEMTYLHGLFILLLAPEFYLPLRALGAAYHARMEALGAAERLVAIEAMPDLARAAPAEAGAPLLSRAPAITLEDIHLTYPGERVALRGISLTVKAGEMRAVAGRSGAGKSSLFALLMGFVTPQVGRILVDGAPLEALPLARFRRSIGYIPQRPMLISATIAANIALGEPQPDLPRMREAARNAGLDARILALPNGYDTRVGPGGQALSGGEVQRLGLARAFYRDAPLVLLDEPTAHLDRETEAAIHAALQRLRANRTVILIAHRASTLAIADRVVTLDAGRVVAP